MSKTHSGYSVTWFAERKCLQMSREIVQNPHEWFLWFFIRRLILHLSLLPSFAFYRLLSEDVISGVTIATDGCAGSLLRLASPDSSVRKRNSLSSFLLQYFTVFLSRHSARGQSYASKCVLSVMTAKTEHFILFPLFSSLVSSCFILLRKIKALHWNTEHNPSSQFITTAHVSKPTDRVMETLGHYTDWATGFPAGLYRVTGGEICFHRHFQVSSGAQPSLLLSRGYRGLFP